MKSFDLVPFAVHSQKLPGKILAPVSKDEQLLNTWKILGIHTMDFFMILTLTGAITSFFGLTMEPFFVTEKLQNAFWKLDASVFSRSVLPLTAFTYFFFSYFMNHGQTYAMSLMKRRVKMQSKSFKEAFMWAAHSLILCFSCGLTFLMMKKKWQDLQAHDYLYQELLTHKDSNEIHLLTRLEENTVIPQIPSQELMKVA